MCCARVIVCVHACVCVSAVCMRDHFMSERVSVWLCVNRSSCICVIVCMYKYVDANMIVMVIGGWVGGVLFAIVQLHVWQQYLPRHRHSMQLCREDLWAFY